MSTETGKIIDAGGYYYYLPEGYDENTAVSFYVHPDYNGEGSKRVREGAIEKGCDSILIIPKVNYPLGGDNSEAYLSSISNFYRQFEQETGQSLNKKNVSVAGWSESANNALTIARNSQSTGDIKINNIIAIDGPYSGYNTSSDAQALMQTIGAAGGSMIIVSAWPERTSTWSARAAELANNGGTAIRLTLTDGSDAGHAWANALTYRCNIPGIYSGGIINPDLATGNDRIKYHIEIYDSKAGGWIELTPAELQAKINSGEIDENSIDEALKQALNTNEVDTVKSDNEVLQSYISKIHESIESSSIHNTSSKQYASTTANPNNQNDIVASFFNSTLQMLGKLVADTNYILTIGSKLQEMDANLKNRLETLPEPNQLAEGSTEVSGSESSSASQKRAPGEVALNIGKAALAGAVVGTMINPGLGTAIGLGVGAVAGTVITFWDEVKGFFNNLGSDNKNDSSEMEEVYEKIPDIGETDPDFSFLSTE